MHRDLIYFRISCRLFHVSRAPILVFFSYWIVSTTTYACSPSSTRLLPLPTVYRVAEVGVLDMLRFHKFTIGHAWCSDYGNAEENEEDFKFLFAYSPVHNVRLPPVGVKFPPLMLCTSDHDDRVVPLHSYKHIATLQHVLGADPTQTNPLLVKVEVKAGHGAGKPLSKVFFFLSFFVIVFFLLPCFTLVLSS